LYDYEAKRDDEVSISAGEVVLVSEKTDVNWWSIEAKAGSGFVPSSFLKELGTQEVDAAISKMYTGGQGDGGAGSGNSNTTPDTGNFDAGSSNIGGAVDGSFDWNVFSSGTSGADGAVDFSSFSLGSATNGKILASSPTTSSIRQSGSMTAFHQPWSQSVDPRILESISPHEKKRQEAIFELIGTEQSYVNDLQLMIELFFQPLASFLSPGEITDLFQNIEEILVTNSLLFSDLENAQQSQNFYIERIGRIFLQHVQSLETYTAYCGNLSAGINFLQTKRQSDKKLAEYLKEAQRNPKSRSLDLSSFILLPMQRITRYTLILKQILQYTPAGHPDYEDVAQAYELSEATADLINTAARDRENQVKLDTISKMIDFAESGQQHFILNSSTRTLGIRKYIYDSPLEKKKTGKKLHGFLFSDILLLCIVKSSRPGVAPYTLYRPYFLLQDVEFQELGGELEFCFATAGEVLAVRTGSVSDKKKWKCSIQLQKTILANKARS